jgi:hypothetical protein
MAGYDACYNKYKFALLLTDKPHEETKRTFDKRAKKNVIV